MRRPRQRYLAITLTKVNDMVVYRAVAIEDEWCSLLPNAPLTGRVTSSFERALNMALADRALSILTRSLGRSPGALLVAETHLPPVPVGATVSVSESTVEIFLSESRRMEIDISEAERYSALVDTPSAHDEPAVTTAACAAACTAFGAVARSGSFTVAATDGDFHQAMSAALRSRASRLQNELAAQLREQNDGRAAVGDAAARLIGLGAGLTPSGDDYLVGCLAVLRQTRRGAGAAAAIGAAIGAAAPGATTAVSRAYLTAAAASRFHEDLAAAARAGLCGDEEAMAATFMRVADVGATSGTDSLRGVVDTLQALAG